MTHPRHSAVIPAPTMSAQETALHLLSRKHWIFDLDGTLTVPVHDFPAIRAALGLSEKLGTLEGIQSLPDAEQKPLMDKLDQIGWDYAEQATAQPGALEFVRHLHEQGCRLAVVTRNNHPCLLESLRRCSMAEFFAEDCLISRDQPPAKPSPVQLNRLLRNWQAEPTDGVMVGDAIYDLQAGRAAGMATIYLDSSNQGGFEDLADLHVRAWPEIFDWAKLD